MNIHAYFTVIWYIVMLPIVFKMLLSMRLEQLFKRGSQTEIRLLYIILTVCISKLFVDYFIDLFNVLAQIF